LKALFADFNLVNANGYIIRSVFAMNGLLHPRCKRGRGGVLRLRADGDLEPICCHRKQMQFRKTIDKLTTKTPIDFSRCYSQCFFICRGLSL
jgi:hypothetical protein